MAYGDIGSVRSTLEFNTLQGNHCEIIKLSDTIAAILSFEPVARELTSVEVNPALPYALTKKDSLVIGVSQYNDHGLCRRTANCALAYVNDNLSSGSTHASLASIIVDDEGAIGAAITDYLGATPVDSYYMDCCHLTGNIIVLVASDNVYDGWIKTASCTAAGDIGASILSSWEFETGIARYVQVLKTSGQFVAVVYQDASDDGWIKTIAISAAGVITNAFQGTLKFDDLGATYPRICHVSGNIYAIVYRNSAGDGKLVTVAIDSSGNIDAAIKDSYVFDAGSCTKPDICKVSDTIVAVVYTDVDDDGQLKTIEINAAGLITEPFLDSLEFETTLAQQCVITHMQGSIYLIAFDSTGYDGFVVSVDIDTPPVGRPHHEMTLGMGP